MKILITGALGHIGSQLIRDLAGFFKNSELILIDNLLTQRYASLFHLPLAGHYRFFQSDLLECRLEEIASEVNVVIHLAAVTDAASSFEHKEKLFHNNLQSTKLISKFCLDHHIPLIFPSSTSVYGTQAEKVDEDCLPEDLKPQSPYAECKLQEEALIQEQCRQGLKATILRLGTIFGPSMGMRFHTAVNKFCWQAALGQEITVWKTAYDQKRPYLGLSDAIRAICFLIEKQRYDGKIYNVVSSNHTVREVVECIQVHYPDLKVAFVESKIMNQLSYEVENKRLSDLHFKCTSSLSEGIRDTFAWLGSLKATQGIPA